MSREVDGQGMSRRLMSSMLTVFADDSGRTILRELLASVLRVSCSSSAAAVMR